MWVRPIFGFFVLAAAVAPGPSVRAQDANALIDRKAALELEKSVLTVRKEVTTLEQQVLTLDKSNRELEEEILTLRTSNNKLEKDLRGMVGIRFELAEYGSGPGKTCNAVEYFKSQCKGMAPCEAKVSNDMCGDPDPSAVSTATIRFTCDNGLAKELKVKSSGKAYINCF